MPSSSEASSTIILQFPSSQCNNGSHLLYLYDRLPCATDSATTSMDSLELNTFKLSWVVLSTLLERSNLQSDHLHVCTFTHNIVYIAVRVSSFCTIGPALVDASLLATIDAIHLLMNSWNCGDTEVITYMYRLSIMW